VCVCVSTIFHAANIHACDILYCLYSQFVAVSPFCQAVISMLLSCLSKQVMCHTWHQNWRLKAANGESTTLCWLYTVDSLLLVAGKAFATQLRACLHPSHIRLQHSKMFQNVMQWKAWTSASYWTILNIVLPFSSVLCPVNTTLVLSSDFHQPIKIIWSYRMLLIYYECNSSFADCRRSMLCY
jgi:hypothetical protein